MKNYTAILFSFCILLFGFGCQPEAKQEVKISKITNTEIQLSDGSKISFPKPAENKSVMFIVRPGEYDKNAKGPIKDLTQKGNEYSEKLKDLLKDVDLNSVLAIGMVAAQNTGRPLADAIGKKVFTFNNVDYGPFLDYIYRIELGKKFMVVDLAIKIPELLYTLTAGESFEMVPDGAYDQMYVVISGARGKAEVHKLKF